MELLDRLTAELVEKISQRRIVTEMERMKTLLLPHDLEAAGYTPTPGTIAWVCEPT